MLFNRVVLASEGPFLDPYYGDHRPLSIENRIKADLSQPDDGTLASRKISVLETALAQSPVKSQQSRGTCSIFSSTAVLEYNLKKVGLTDDFLDLSEQWLEYITAGQRGQEGSWSYYNFDRYGDYGFIDEEVWPYHGMSWHPYKEDYWTFTASVLEKEIFKLYCEPLKDTRFFNGCLIGQLDPQLLHLDDRALQEKDAQFYERRSQALENLKEAGIKISSRTQWSDREVQDSLDSGDVVSLDIDFFYEAWNHRKAIDLGLQTDSNLWSQGVVSFPDSRSKDYQESRKSENRAGHSIVLVGYDKNKVIERNVEDVNGDMITISSQGVYYFKNSWGQDSFGSEFTLQGQSLPGFGMISMAYAHRDGRFYRMMISKTDL